MIRVREYPERMHWFKVHFDLLHRALNHLSCDKEALKSFIAEEEKKYSMGLDSYLKTEEGRPRDVLDDMVVSVYKIRLERQMQNHVEFAENKLHQTEIVLRCAFFEAEMKDIHRHCLCAKPTLLRGEKDVALGRLISRGEDAVLEEEIAAEVDKIDRQNTKERAKYFKEKLGLKWGDPNLFEQFYRLKSPEEHKDVVLKIENYSNLRNKIMHDDNEYVVKLDELSEARSYFSFVPSFCCQQAVKIYPTHFSEN